MVVAWNFYKHFTPSGVRQSAQPITNDSAHWCKIKVLWCRFLNCRLNKETAGNDKRP